MGFKVYIGRMGYAASGQLGETYRPVVLAGTATSNSYVNSNSFIRQRMLEVLQENGIGIVALRLNPSGYQVNFEVEVNAWSGHSGEQVRQMVQQALNNATYVHSGYTPQRSYLLKNVSLRVVSDDTRTQSQNQSQWPTPAVNVNITNPNNPSGKAGVPDPPSGLNSFFAEMGKSLGVSAPIAIGATLLIGLVILKKF